MKPTKGLIFFLLFAILLISFSFYGYQVIYTPNILVEKQDRLLVIPEKATFKDVQDALHKGRYVEDLISFSFLAKLMDYDDHVKPGHYVLKAGMTNIKAIQLLRSGNQNTVNITFNNVRLIRELSEKITKNLNMSPEAFEAALIKFAMANNYGFTKDNVLTMFIPNTYQVFANIEPDALIKKMHHQYDFFWNTERLEKAKKLGLTPIEVSILASIVQAETIKKAEAPIIAGLYLNRLEKGIALQADPTLVFAVGDFTLKRVLNEHKRIDSPYNTYLYPGLPPGPINMPEINSLDAVLNNFKSNYYYMCAKEDFSGNHNFTNSYQQHILNAARYQQALTIEQRKGRVLLRQNQKHR